MKEAQADWGVGEAPPSCHRAHTGWDRQAHGCPGLIGERRLIGPGSHVPRIVW